MVSMPFTLYCSLLLNPGEPLGSFIPIHNSTLLIDETDMLLSFDYSGGAFFQTGYVGSNEIMMLIFIGGCFIVPVPCCIVFLIPYTPIAAFILLGFLTATNAHNFSIEMPNWDILSFWNYLLFSVNIDWENLRVIVPSMIAIPATWTILMGLSRLSQFSSRTLRQYSNYFCGLKKIVDDKVAPMTNAGAAGILSAREGNEPVNLGEMAVETAQETAQDKVKETAEGKVIELVDKKLNTKLNYKISGQGEEEEDKNTSA